MGRIATILLLALASCTVANQPPRAPGVMTEDIPVWVDARFTVSERTAIGMALESWNGTLNGYAHFRPVTSDVADPDAAIRPPYWLDQWVTINRDDSGPALLLAWTSSVGGHRVHMIPSMIEEHQRSLEAITLHELGHVLGLDDDIVHIGTLMGSPVTAMVDCIDARTVNEIAELHRWQSKYMEAMCP